jgi:hypothetical protein
MAGKTPINNDYLTEDENSDDENIGNFYKFISGEAQRNNALDEYLDHIGLDEEFGINFLTEQHMKQIYKLLDVNEKQTMKTQFMKNIRNIVGNQRFRLEGGARKSKKSLKKTRKTRKNRTRILRKK